VIKLNKGNIKITKMYNKKGVSLAALIITIIVAVVLISASIVGVKNSIDKANIAVYAEDLASIHEATENYYIKNDEFPLIDGTDAISQEDVINLAGEGIVEELVENGDYIENPVNPELTGAYYMIDLAKIDVEKTVRGNRSGGASNDVYVASYPSMNIYYLKGVKIEGKIHYSLNKTLISMTKINLDNVKDTSTTTIQTVASMTVKKIDKKWTNKLGISASVIIEENEKIYLSVAGGTLKEITPLEKASFDLGSNTFTIDSLLDIIAGTESVKVAGLSVEDDNLLTSLAQEAKYIEFVKYKSGVEVGRIKVDLSNYEKEVPVRVTEPVIESKEKSNWISFKVSDAKSGIKEVRYEYLTRYNDTGSIQNYYKDVTSLDDTYMKTRAKKVAVSTSGYIQIKVPKNIEGIQILVLDKAGNWFNMTQPVYSLTRTPGASIYTGIIPKSVGETMATFKVVTNSINGLNTLKTYISLDGVNFTDEKIFTLNTASQITIQDVDDYSNIVNKNGDFYIKVVVTDNLGKIETTITSLAQMKEDLKDSEIKLGINAPVLATGMTPIKWDATGNIVTTTESDYDWYDYENKKWANAQTADGSIWVWIPRYEYDIKDENEHTSNAGSINVNFISGVNAANTAGYIIHPAFKFGTEELTGIWVAKFEASGNINAVDIKPNVTSLRSLNIDAIFTACKNMETNSRYGWGTTGDTIDTHLMKNIEWGAVSYLSNSIYGKNSQIWINPNSNYLTGQAGTTVNSVATNTTYEYKDTTYGVNASTTGNVYGLYDMSGGAFEYTAAYINNTNASLLSNGASLVNSEEKYKDIYIVTDDSALENYNNAITKKGDGVYETSSSVESPNTNSWYLGDSYMPNNNYTFFVRGGDNALSLNASIFSFSDYFGSASHLIGFRPTLIVSK
jgi:hypothetical protein